MTGTADAFNAGGLSESLPPHLLNHYYWLMENDAAVREAQLLDMTLKEQVMEPDERYKGMPPGVLILMGWLVGYRGGIEASDEQRDKFHR